MFLRCYELWMLRFWMLRILDATVLDALIVSRKFGPFLVSFASKMTCKLQLAFFVHCWFAVKFANNLL